MLNVPSMYNKIVLTIIIHFSEGTVLGEAQNKKC